TFNFLGFTFICGKTRTGKFQLPQRRGGRSACGTSAISGGRSGSKTYENASQASRWASSPDKDPRAAAARRKETRNEACRQSGQSPGGMSNFDQTHGNIPVHDA